MSLKLAGHAVRMAPTQEARTPTLKVVSPRPSGRRWQKTRLRVQVAQRSTCVDCGLLWRPEVDQVDHDTPRDIGGSDADTNLRLRCYECHAAKTKNEAQMRARGLLVRGV